MTELLDAGGSPWPIQRTPTDYWERMKACADAYGGCDAMGQINQRFLSLKGQSYGIP